jgi:hypothetical protein
MSLKELIREISTLGLDTFILEDLSSRTIPQKNVITEALGALPAGGRLFAGAEDIEDAKLLDGLGLDGAIISISKLLKGLR